MASTLKGRLGTDPELKTGPSGNKRATFSFAKPNGPRDGDIPPTWINVSCFNGKEDTFAENVAATFKKGDFVEIEGDWTNYDKTVFDADGKEFTLQMLSFNAFDVKTGTRYATLTINRNERRGGGGDDEAPARKAPAKKAASAPASDDF